MVVGMRQRLHDTQMIDDQIHVKDNIISKINTFHNNIKYYTEALPFYMFDCLKMLLTATNVFSVIT